MAVSEGVSIPAKGCFLIYASGKDFHNARELHTNFKLSTAGEPVVLSNPQGEIVDYIPPVEIPRIYRMDAIRMAVNNFSSLLPHT